MLLMSGRDSLFQRLMISSAVWIVLTLLLTGILVVYLFHNHIRDRLENQLADHLEELVAASDIGPGGDLVLTWRPADPRFNRPHSGWYWQITDPANGMVVHRAASLLHKQIAFGLKAGAAAQLDGRYNEAVGPDGNAVYAIARTISLPRAGRPYVFMIAGPPSNVLDEVEIFSWNLAIVLGVLFVFLLFLIWIQVGFGLRPFTRLRGSLGAIRSGGIDRLPQDFPREIQGLVTDLNALMDYNETLLSRARGQVANLAHAIKNPLAILANEARFIEGERGARMQEQIHSASQRINRYLQHARIAGTKNVLGVSSNIAAVCQDLAETLNILYREKEIKVTVAVEDFLRVKVESDDLVELLGNLMDNAAKWARTAVQVHIADSGAGDDAISILIDDDGAGVPPELRESVLKRGYRRDEQEPGDGFGLSIAQEITDLYGGSLLLTDSPLGGLRVVVSLPQAGRHQQESCPANF